MMRRFVFLLLCCVASKAAFAHELRFIGVNVGKEDLECFYASASMASGYPEHPATGDTSFKAGETKDISRSFSSGRMAVIFSVYKDGVYLISFRGYANNASGTFKQYFAFSGDSTNGNLQTWNNADPRPPAPLSNSVPLGWPSGRASAANGLKQIEGLGYYYWDGEGFILYSPFTDSTQAPPADLLPAGHVWKFGIRPGGPVFAANSDMPEWYSDYPNGLIPTDWVDDNGLPVQNIPQDFDGDGTINQSEASAARLDFWGRNLSDLGAVRNGLLTDINGKVVGFNADLVVGFDRLKSVAESTSASEVQAIQAGTASEVQAIQAGTASEVQAIQAGTAASQESSANIVESVEQNAQVVKLAIEQASTSEIKVDLGEGSYAGYGGLVDLDGWSNLDADIYKTGVDTNFHSAAISPSIASADYNIATGESFGDGNSFISGLGSRVAGAVQTLFAGVSAFVDPFKAIGKVESLTVTIYSKPMVIDFGPFMSVINVVRAIAVLVVYYLSFCSVRSAVFMIFGGA